MHDFWRTHDGDYFCCSYMKQEYSSPFHLLRMTQFDTIKFTFSQHFVICFFSLSSQVNCFHFLFSLWLPILNDK